MVSSLIIRSPVVALLAMTPLLLFLVVDQRSSCPCLVHGFSPSAVGRTAARPSASASASSPSKLVTTMFMSSDVSSSSSRMATTRPRFLNSTDDSSFMMVSSSSSSLTYNQNQKRSAADEHQRGLITIGAITLLFASNSPVLHAAFSSGENAPPVLLLNAAVSVVALVGLLVGGKSLESNTPLPSSLLEQQIISQEEQDRLTLQGGCELGLWKFLGTTANLYGLALTTAGHGALLIQLTTLIVPLVQGIQGVPIPQRIQASIVLALAGVVCFTQDPTGTPSATGDALCVLAAVFYATYDLRLFAWGKRVAARNLITSKIGTQAILSVLLLAAVSGPEALEYVTRMNSSFSNGNGGFETWSALLPVVVWSGVAVNAVAPFLQVGGQQAVGPTRCQTIYASQPLWAAMMSFVFLGETIGVQGMVGGSAFLAALFLAATTSSSSSSTVVEED